MRMISLSLRFYYNFLRIKFSNSLLFQRLPWADYDKINCTFCFLSFIINFAYYSILAFDPTYYLYMRYRQKARVEHSKIPSRSQRSCEEDWTTFEIDSIKITKVSTLNQHLILWIWPDYKHFEQDVHWIIGARNLELFMLTSTMEAIETSRLFCMRKHIFLECWANSHSSFMSCWITFCWLFLLGFWPCYVVFSLSQRIIYMLCFIVCDDIFYHLQLILSDMPLTISFIKKNGRFQDEDIKVYNVIFSRNFFSQFNFSKKFWHLHMIHIFGKC